MIDTESQLWLCIQMDRSHTVSECPTMVILILTTLWKVWSESVVRKKIIHYRQFYEYKPDPIIFLSVTVNTSGQGRVYDDFVRQIVRLFHTYTLLQWRSSPRRYF